MKIIISSGYNEQEVTQQFDGEGLDGFLHKPYTLEQLSALLQKLLKDNTV